MRIHIIAGGRFRPGPERDLYERYAERINPKPLLKEARDSRALRAAIPKGALVAALDEKGKALSSRALAAKIGEWRGLGGRDLAFLIGGDDGLDEGVLKGAGLVLSLGSMTWPHLLARGMLAEQLYRAQCILSGHPYHRQ